MSEEKKDLAEEKESVEETAGEEKIEKKKEGSSLYCWAQAVVTAVVGVILLFTFGVRLISVNGPSMQDTLYTGDRLLVLNAMFCDFKAGDVVVINDYNAELDDTLVKRIIAVGGQTVDVDIVSGSVYVDGQLMDETYIKEPTYTTGGVSFPLTLAEDEVFVMGDNRNHSTDSRDTRLGPVKTGYLQGRALFLVTPGATPDTAQKDWGRVGLIH